MHANGKDHDRLTAASQAPTFRRMNIEHFSREPVESAGGAYDNFVVVLNETQDLVNIAGAVRALLNMGLRRLRLVRPAEFDAYRIAGIAHGSEELLERIEFFDSLQEAVADCVHVVGTTARRRSSSFVWQHARQAAPELLALARSASAPIALVFGREDKGLSNEDLDLCDRVLTIPTDPRHSSLNLAQTVLLICYELWLAGAAGERALPEPRRRADRLANVEEMSSLFEQTENALAAIDFFKKRNPAATLRTLRAITRRANLDTREARLLRAIAYEIQNHLKRLSGRP
jgi:TrmH family RNA methyltransferase